MLPGCSRGRRAAWGCTVMCLSNPSALQFCTVVTNAPFILNLSSHSSLLQFPEIVSWPSVCLAQAEQQPVTLCQVYLSPRLPHVHHSHPDRSLQEPLQGKPVEILLGIQRGCVERSSLSMVPPSSKEVICLTCMCLHASVNHISPVCINPFFQAAWKGIWM